MTTLNYELIDVFTSRPFGGNQLAVFHDEIELSAETMQKIARELNLSETVFIRPPSNQEHHKNLRIFTPKIELPMAGHPTVGAAFVLASKGIIPTEAGTNEWLLEEQIGEVPVTVYKEAMEITKVEMTQPLPVFGSPFQKPGLVADLLSLSPKDLDNCFPIQSVSSGIPFLFIPVRSLNAMKEINFRADIWERQFSQNQYTQHIFVFTMQTEEKQSTVHSRMFAPAMGIQEDPATGAASGPLGAYLVEHGMIPATTDGTYLIRSEQGFEIERPSYIDITIVKKGSTIKEVKIGGQAVTMGKGQIILDV
ncbi:PhzF family phenazine biosynthesis protein [Planococcus shenhongbingii]|uniref:PhzF family phenazine biosynthesis protein n=1 Tax=Planococcus shenhongbingii TaxID=3058398 RepID=UPI002625796E|nr:PhzF family phenazine biosynthesis protein [Planococcus sp. N016]WKA59501.1 PhzF family phenazine biosynthesis protein [Planococcus sp. N016]